MKIDRIRSATIGILLFLIGLVLVDFAQADTGYSMMGRGEHRGMMGYGYGQGRYMEEEEKEYGRGPFGMGGEYCPLETEMMGYGRMGPGMMGYGPMGQGMMDYGHMGGGMMGDWLVMRLDLSDDQEKKIKEIHRRQRREHWAQMGELMEQQEKLADLYAVDTPDPKAIGKVYADIFEIKRKGIENSIRAHNEVRGLLTEEQRKALKEALKKSGSYMGRYGHMR